MKIVIFFFLKFKREDTHKRDVCQEYLKYITTVSRHMKWTFLLLNVKHW